MSSRRLWIVAFACLAAACGDNIRPFTGTPAVVVTPKAGLTTTESGGQAMFTVVLGSQPKTDVSIALSSSAVDEGVIDTPTVLFTKDNWNAPQVITITGVNDDLADGVQPYTIVTAAAVSDDSNYDTLNGDDVEITNTDNDTAGITATPIANLVTTESGGQATFSLVLNAKPTADVTIALSSSDLSEGECGPGVVFTTDNWNAPQIVTVTGIDDDLADGPQAYTIVTAAAVSSDVGYANMDGPDVSVSNTDNDSAGITVSVTSGLVTDENGLQANFTIVLNSQPTADVTIPLDSNDLTEGTASPTSITFTTLNWNAAQTITLTGQNDNLADGNQVYSIVTAAATSSDTTYAGIDAADVSVLNVDNDSAGITVTPIAGLTTDEFGAQANFTIVLNSQPTADVTIDLTSSDLTEGTISPGSVTFTATDWNAPQTITITGQNDAIADGNQPYSIITAPATSTDANYAARDAANVSVTNNDNDSGGIIVSPTINLVTTEAGGQATFTIVLSSQPLGIVTIPLSSDDITEGTVSPASVTFTTTDWNAAQTVTITGVNDSIADGNQPYSIVTSPATSTDPSYANRDATDVQVSNTDNDTASITVSPIAGLTTTETGGQATFTVVLNSQPSDDVRIDLSSNDLTEGTLDVPSVTFTSINWNAPQTVTVTGVNDAIADGNQPYRIVTAPAVSTDVGYSARDAADVAVTNIDNDTAGITVEPIAGLTTTEAGGQATFTIVLNSQPTADVTIGLTSSDSSEGTADVASVLFTSVNWNAPQTITVTGEDDVIADGNQTYRIVTAAAVSTDAAYSTRDAADVSLSNTDNDTASITVSPSTGLTTTEAGGQATFTISLNSQPTASVTIGLTSSDTGEGSVGPASVVFTTLDWNAPQTVTITGIDDALDDGNQPFQIITAPAISADANYSTRDAIDVAVTNIDNDTAGITVTPIAGLTTTETGGQATFTVVLNSQPTVDVTIGLSSSDLTEGTVAPSSIVFTSANWNAPQTIAVTGVNDAITDGNQPYTIITAPAVSGDPDYTGRNAADVSVTNTDNDTAGITVTPVTGLVTTESGGQDTFQVVLVSQPTADVTIGLSSSDTGEGTVSPASIVFTSVNWNAPRTITVTGVNDAIADGNQAYTIATAPAVSIDPNYTARDAADVAVSNTDNDTAGITVSPTTGLVTSEAGAQATFTIVLNSQPTTDVTIGVTSSDTTEGTVNPASLVFTSVNWNAPRTVTVTGINDAFADGDQPYTIITSAAVSSDAGYSGRTVADVSVSNTDNDTAGITVSPTTGLVTTEAGGQTTFTIVLNSQPSNDVTIGLTSSDTTEGTISVASVVFTSVNWNAPRTITVTGVNDALADGDQPYTIVTAAAISSDAGYSNHIADDVSVTNTDNDTAGITVTPVAGLTTTEAGGQATFTIVLNSQPSNDVTIGLTSSDTTEGTVSVGSIVFTTVNWNAPRTITVTGANDALVDGDQPYMIITSAAVSSDAGYSNRNADDVAVTNTDNDTDGITVSPIAGLTTTEAGGQATFSIVLTSQPTADVTIGLTSSDTTEGTVAPASIVFTTLNWNAPRTITVTGVEDGFVDGDQPFTIITAAAVSADAGYSNRNAADVAVTNTDNDTAGILVNPTAGLTTTEAGATATFAIVLQSQPAFDVIIPISTSDSTEGTVSPTSVTFTAVNWNAPQIVTVAGVNDAIADGDQLYTIINGVATSSDSTYNNMDPADVTVTNTDNDSAGFTVTPTSGISTTESGGQATFTVVLNSQPSSDVTIDLTSTDTGEGTVAQSSLTFTSANWNAAQTVTVTGINDAVADGNQPYSIITAPATSSDASYNNLDAPDVALTNIDNDSASIIVTPVSGLVTTEAAGGDQFTVVLGSQPTSDVTIGLSSTDTTEGTVFPASLVFTTTNWNVTQTVTVTGVGDTLTDGNQVYTIVTADAVSSDIRYSGLPAADVDVTNVDDDVAGFTIDAVGGLFVSEFGDFDDFTIVLNTQPTANVTISLTSSDTGEGTVSPTSVTFTTANWNVPQIVTVTGVNDNLADGNQAFLIVTGAAVSGDLAYSGLNPVDVDVTNFDNDTPNVYIKARRLLRTSENGQNSKFGVSLTTQPAADVTCTFSSSDTTEGTLAPTTLVFTPTNFATLQNVTITGVDDALNDGDQLFTMVSATCTSADPNYNNLDPRDLAVLNRDND